MAFASCAAYAQFATLSSRESMNPNDNVHRGQLGPDSTVAPLPLQARSTRGVQVTASQADISLGLFPR